MDNVFDVVTSPAFFGFVGVLLGVFVGAYTNYKCAENLYKRRKKLERYEEIRRKKEEVYTKFIEMRLLLLRLRSFPEGEEGQKRYNVAFFAEQLKRTIMGEPNLLAVFSLYGRGDIVKKCVDFYRKSAAYVAKEQFDKMSDELEEILALMKEDLGALEEESKPV